MLIVQGKSWKIYQFLQPLKSMAPNFKSRVDVTKFVGVLIDENLTWSNHIDFKSKKIIVRYWSTWTTEQLRNWVGGGGGGGGTSSDSILRGHKTLFLTNSLYFKKYWGGGGYVPPGLPTPVVPGSIKRIRHFVLPVTPHRVYEGVVQAHFDYCSIVWGNLWSTNYKDFKIGQRGFWFSPIMTQIHINYSIYEIGRT